RSQPFGNVHPVSPRTVPGSVGLYSVLLHEDAQRAGLRQSNRITCQSAQLATITTGYRDVNNNHSRMIVYRCLREDQGEADEGGGGTGVVPEVRARWRLP